MTTASKELELARSRALGALDTLSDAVRTADDMLSDALFELERFYNVAHRAENAEMRDMSAETYEMLTRRGRRLIPRVVSCLAGRHADA